MAETRLKGSQIKDADVTETQLATSVAGNGLAGGAGTPFSVDLNELSAAVVDVANDSLSIIDAGDSSSKKEAIADLIAAIAGVGLSSTAGVLALDLNELAAFGSGEALDVAADSFALIDATDSATKQELIADLITAIAGNGLGATSGVLAVGVDDSTVELNADAVRVKALGITNAELALGSVDVDNLSDFRVTEGTALNADFAAGTLRNDNTIVTVAASTVAVTDNDTSFVEVDSAGSVTSNVSGFTSGRIPLAEVVAASGDITSVTDKRAWLDIEIGASGLTESDFVDNEVPSGDLDGVDVTYTLTQSPSPTTSLKLYKNGNRLDEGASDDYTLSGGTITYAVAPVSDDKLIADFRF